MHESRLEISITLHPCWSSRHAMIVCIVAASERQAHAATMNVVSWLHVLHRTSVLLSSATPHLSDLLLSLYTVAEAVTAHSTVM